MDLPAESFDVFVTPKTKSFMAERYFYLRSENIKVCYQAFDQSWMNVDGRAKIVLDRRL